MNYDDYKFINFKPKWSKMRKDLWDMSFDLFYDVVDICGTVGHRISPDLNRSFNPHFYCHWFPSGRCHMNVILPCFMLNGDSFEGDWQILTNDKHSIIINTKKKILICPTLNNREVAFSMLKDNVEILSLIEHCFRGGVEPCQHEKLLIFCEDIEFDVGPTLENLQASVIKRKK